MDYLICAGSVRSLAAESTVSRIDNGTGTADRASVRTISPGRSGGNGKAEKENPSGGFHRPFRP